MKYEMIPIHIDGSAEETKFHAYILDCSQEYQPDLKRPMIILCPGGGYGMTSDREAEPIAMRLLGMGYHVGILRYSVAPARFPTALLELAEVMKLVHENGEIWHVNTRKIFVQGSSAGGHLAACLGVFWNQPFLYKKAGVNPEILRPCGMILNYPVITTQKPFLHEGSFLNLLGENSGVRREELSIEKLVTKDMPPCFVWHTFSDRSVPVENSLFLVSALKQAGVSTELHIYPEGEHGLSLGDEVTAYPDGSKVCKAVQSWINLLNVWLGDQVSK